MVYKLYHDILCTIIFYTAFFFCKIKMVFHFWDINLYIMVLNNWPIGYNVYGNTYFKWCHYFLFMLLGDMLGISSRRSTLNLNIDLIKLIVSTIIYYGILFAGKSNTVLFNMQILSLIPLLFIVFYFYKNMQFYIIKKMLWA